MSIKQAEETRDLKIQDEMVDPTQLSYEEWNEIISSNQLLKGWCVDGDKPIHAEKIAFELIDKNNIAPNYEKTFKNTFDSKLAYTQREKQFIREGFNAEKVKAAYDFVSGSAEYTHSEHRENQSEERTVYITGSCDISVANLSFTEKEIRPTVDFENAVKSALNDGSSSDRYYKLCKVFEEYGQIFASTVSLGGKYRLEKKETYQSTKDFKEVKDSVNAAIAVKYKEIVDAEANIKAGTESQENQKAVELAQSMEFTTSGGYQFLGDLNDWYKSLSDYKYWVGISFQGIKPIYELLDNDLQNEVKWVLGIILNPPMRLRRFEKTSDEILKNPTYSLEVPKGYKIISGGATVIDKEKKSKLSTVTNMLWASYPKKLNNEKDYRAWEAMSWDGQASGEEFKACIQISVIALYDPENKWEVKVFHKTSQNKGQTQKESVKIDNDYYLTGGGAEIHDSSLKYENGYISSFLVGSYPDFQKNEKTWTARSHDHVSKDLHYLTVYAIGVRTKEGNHLDVKHWIQASGDSQRQYPTADAMPENQYVLVGGGANVDVDVNHHLTASYPASRTDDKSVADVWKAVSTDQHIKKPAILTAYAIGVKGAEFPEDLPEE